MAAKTLLIVFLFRSRSLDVEDMYVVRDGRCPTPVVNRLHARSRAQLGGLAEAQTIRTKRDE